VKDLSVNLVDLAKSYQQTGDQASADAVLKIAANLGQRYSSSSGGNGLNQLVGMAAEAVAFYGMDLNSPYGSNGQTVQDHLNQLMQQRRAIRGFYQQAVPLLGTMSEQDWSSYSDRVQMFGESAALQWVLGRFGQK